MDRYVKIKPLGKGSFGSAILIRRRSDNQLLVVKEVNLSKMSPKEREEARNECKVLHQLNHPNIVRYMEHYEHHGVLYIIMEYADGGDLAQKIKQNGGRGLSEDTIMYYFSQLCLALEYLHSRHILHRDIKTMNVFLMKNGAVKLGDFGISTILRNTMGMANTVCGTPYYFSPELCKNKPYNNRSDIWALGVVLYELMTGKHPFDANSMQQLMQRIVKSSYAPPPSTYSKELRQLLDICLQKEAMRRPTIKQLLGFPIVRRSLEALETNLMLATQCRVRLQDIIDFPARNHADKGGGSNAATPIPASHSAPSSNALPDAVVVRDDPRSARAAAAKTPPPAAHRGALPPAHQPPQVIVHGQAAQGGGNAGPGGGIGGVSNQLRADLDRVDAFIRQLNQPVQERAKDAIQEYMKRKQEELAERKKREAEMQKKQEERNQELKRIMEDHQRQMLEHAKLKQQRVSQAQQNPPPTHLGQAAAAPSSQPQSDVTPSEARRQSKPRPQQQPPPAGGANHPSVLQQMYGRVSPRRRPKAIAANSPAYARQLAANPKGAGHSSPSTGNLVAPVPPSGAVAAAAAPQPCAAAVAASPAILPSSRPLGHMYVDIPMGVQQRQQVAERAQHWVDRQAEKRRAELDARHQRKLEDERKMVRDLDSHQHLHAQRPVVSLANKVVDPELEAWVRRTTAAPDVIGHRRESRSLSPSAGPLGAHEDLPAGVDARRRATSTPPLSSPSDAALQRHVHAVDAVFREQQQHHQLPQPTSQSSRQPVRQPVAPVSVPSGSSPSMRPRTPPGRDGGAPAEFRRRHTDGSSQPASSRSSSAASDAAMRIPAPADVPDDRRLPVHDRPAVHTGPLSAAMQPRSEGKLTAHPMVRYASAPETLLEDEEDEITVPEIIRSFRGPSLEDELAFAGREGSSGPASKSPEPEVPVEAYERMLDHLKYVLDKKPVSSQATRHHVALLDADVLSESDAEVVDTEEELFRRTDDDGDEEDESDADDFADEEPITPPHLSRTAGGQDGDGSATPDRDDDNGDDDDDEVDLEEEPNLAGDYRFHQLCGRSFRGQCATNPATGRSLFPVTSVSRQTNEFQLRALLEKRLGVVALDSVVAQLEALPLIRRSPSDGSALGVANASVQEVRSAVATYLAKMKRCPTAAVGQVEVNETLALVAQLLFFRDA